MSMMSINSLAFGLTNNDGKTIYYTYINNGTELEVVKYSSDHHNNDVYNGIINIPEEVTYGGETFKVTKVSHP